MFGGRGQQRPLKDVAVLSFSRLAVFRRACFERGDHLRIEVAYKKLKHAINDSIWLRDRLVAVNPLALTHSCADGPSDGHGSRIPTLKA